MSKKIQCSTYRHPLCILYGSATGNSEHIAKDLTKQIQQDVSILYPTFDNVICCELDQYKKMGCQALWEQPIEDVAVVTTTDGTAQSPPVLQYQYHGVLIICSTSGNGDPPENASRFVRHVKKAATTATSSLSSSSSSAIVDSNSLLLFRNVCYAILGLGDTNYDQYCAAAVTIDRAIHQLGGHKCFVGTSSRKSALTCADEGSGQLEDVVEPWIATIVKTIVQACSSSSDDHSLIPTAVSEDVDPAVTDGTTTTDPELAVDVNDTENAVIDTTTTTNTTAPTNIAPVDEPNIAIPVQKSMGIRMMQLILASEQQQQQQPHSNGADDQCIDVSSLLALDIDSSTLPSTTATTTLNDESASDTTSTAMKPFTFVASQLEKDTIDENEVFTDNTIQQRIRGLSIGSNHQNSNNTTTPMPPDYDSVSSVSAGYYYTIHNPYESQMLSARYLTNTSITIGATKVVESIIHMKQQQQQHTERTMALSDDPSGYYKDAEGIYDTAFPLTTIATTATEKARTDRNGKRVIEMTLSLPDDSTLEYSPGDSVGIVVENPISMVQFLVNLLQHNDPSIQDPYQQMIHINNENGLHRSTTATPITVADAISRHLDICSTIKNKRIILALSQLATDPIEQQCLQLLSSKSIIGEATFRRMIDEQRMNVVDLIQCFPSMQSNITLEVLFRIVPNSIPPRYYSVSSSPLQQPVTSDPDHIGRNHHCLTVAFSVVDYITPSLVVPTGMVVANDDMTTATKTVGVAELGQRRVRGIATRYLEAISSSLLCRTNEMESNGTTTLTNPKEDNAVQKHHIIAIPKIRIFPKPTIDFHMPHSLSTPLILIGPGTGIAPFMGFLRHRQTLIHRQRNNVNNSTNGNSEYSTTVAAQTIVEGTWRGGYELHHDDNELAISLQDESGLNVGADYRMKSSQAKGPDDDTDSSEYGAVDVLFGCRYKDHDWLYRDEMHELLHEGIISKLYTAFSRDDTVTNGDTRYRYVQDIIQSNVECSQRFIDLILHHDAAVYVCGDGNSMGQDVQTAIVRLLSTTSQFQDNLDMSKAYLEEMKRKQRFLMDIWS